MSRATPHPTVLTPTPGSEKVDLGLVDALAQLSFSVHGILGRIAAAHDLSIVQARLLGILRDRRPTIKELAAILQLDKSSVTGLVDRAEERGLVRRVAAPADRRSVHVVISAAGQRIVDRATNEFDADIERLVSELSVAERRGLTATASRIVVAEARRRGIDLSSNDPPGRA